MRDSFADLGIALIAAVIFTYLIMVALYDSFVYPLVVLFSIPLAMIGALLALALTMKSLSIFTILGIIMLVGLVGKNAILLVDRTNAVRAEGVGVYDALVDAGKMRLRPILMTTFTMIFGMMPIALSTAAGGEWKSGLAWAIIGGLTSSLVLTLIFVPIVYSKMEELRISVPALAKRIIKRMQPSAKPILEPEVAAVKIED
jgi:HAE1 family hydrophobic/amphiphilic exporter-1